MVGAEEGSSRLHVVDSCVTSNVCLSDSVVAAVVEEKAEMKRSDYEVIFKVLCLALLIKINRQ